MSKRIVVLIALCFLFTATVYASYAWLTNNDLRHPATFRSEWDYDNGTHHVFIEISRGAYDSATGTVQVSASVKVDEAKVIEQIWLETADDLNSNAIIESGEWANRATGTITSSVNSTRAIVPATKIDVEHDAYRLRWQWEDGGLATETVLTPGFTE